MTLLTVTSGEAALVSLNTTSQYVARVRRVGDAQSEWSRISAPRLPGGGAGAGGISWATPPQNSSAPGDPGDVAYDDNYLYLRTSQAWRQIALEAMSSNITITQQPQSASVEDGQQATFTVLATSSEAISYQWSSSTDGVSFAAINGATSNALTINATLSDNGSQYRALLSAAGAADVTTNVATLTVNETFRLLTANNDTLLTEAGDTLNHDGVVDGGDWEQDGTAFSTSGRVYGYSPDADILYWPTDTTSSGFAVQGIQRYERDANGTFAAVGNAVNTGWNTLETVPGISSSADGSKVVVTNDQSTGSDSGTYSLAGYTVYEYANGTLSSVYSGSQDSYTLVAISGDGGVWAGYRDDGTVRVESASGLIGTPFATGYDVYHIALNNDGSKIAMSRYGDVTSDGNADAHTRAYQWTGSAWTQMGGDFLSAANVSGGMPSQPIALSSAGSRIAIGFSTESGDHTESGVVRVYDWSGSAWVQAGSDISGAAAYDFFGSSVSLSSDGTRLAVGARGNDSAASNAGRTSVYQYSAGSWFKIGTDIDGPATTNAYAGSEVFLSSDGNYLGVGASGAETLTRYLIQ